MNSRQLSGIGSWFTNYIDAFSGNGDGMPAALQLKVEHTRRVADNARQLAEALEWNPEEANCAEAVGWLHDVGRFSQFSEYGTFSDADSVNHGERGWHVVLESELPSCLPPGERGALLDGIRYHNARTVPDGLGEQSMRCVRLIRDADKLDIYRIVLDSVHRDGFRELPSMLQQIDLNGPISPKVVSTILEHRSASIGDLRSLSDYLLMLLSWVYDLNHTATLQQVIHRNIIDDLERLLPRSQGVELIVQAVRLFTESRLTMTHTHAGEVS